MFNHLNPRTKQELIKLLSGTSITLGNEVVVLEEQIEKKLLYILSFHFQELKNITGATLADRITELLNSFQDQDLNELEAPESIISKDGNWKLGKIHACSFRGLAPAGEEWSFDFNGNSHLLHGSNGAGKTSLLGAISWCINGRIFRDDSPPSFPEDIPVYSTDEPPQSIGTRPDALSLLDTDGNNTQHEEEYWVALEFISTDDRGVVKKQWIKRHNTEGLMKSGDGHSWTSIESINEAGISEIDAELHILMPARVPYLRFGKESDFIKVLSQVVGLDDLEVIAEIASRLHMAMVRNANTLESKDLKKEKSVAIALIEDISSVVTENIRSLNTYENAMGSTRTSEKITAFGQALRSYITKKKAQLIDDLNIEPPEKDSPSEKSFNQDLDALPFHVQTLMTTIEKPIDQIFNTSIGVAHKNPEVLVSIEDKLKAFEDKAREQINDRLEWAIKESENQKASLMLLAAEHFDEESDECPVCTQNLTHVPNIRKALSDLADSSSKAFLKKMIHDLELSLIDELNLILPQMERDKFRKTLGQRIGTDWQSFKNSAQGLTAILATKYDDAIADVIGSINPENESEHEELTALYKVKFPDKFNRLNQLLIDAKDYVRWTKTIQSNLEAVSASLQLTITGKDSLKEILEAGSITSQEMRVATPIMKNTEKLFFTQKEIEKLQRQISYQRNIAQNSIKIRGLNTCVTNEVINFVKSVEPRLKAYYEHLYDQEHLTFDMITTGHPANPGIRNDLNVYFKAGGERVPIAPFINAGRFRALTVSFVFALLEESDNSFGLLLLDDPVYSFDDEHKARFVSHLVQPLFENRQIIMATHYKTFYDIASPIFLEYERLEMPPKRTASDQVAFEPADLLSRVENAIKEPNCRWRSEGINLRKWVESTLRAISGYCPQPFYIYGNLIDCINNYASSVDPDIATNKRNQIILTLRSVEFTTVYNKLAHDEDPTDTETRDLLEKLKSCRKIAYSELRRLKGLHLHRVTNRNITTRIIIGKLNAVISSGT